MSYNNWDIPSDLFNIKPVGRETIQNFIGRNSFVERIGKLIAAKNIRILLEGDIGTGKTSLGNYIRFTQENSFTTDMEIMCQSHWQSREFLLALQSSVIATCKKDPKLQELLNKDIFKRIYERNSNIRISNYQGGVQLIGSGVSAGQTEAISQPLHLDDQTLIPELNEMLELIRQKVSSQEQCQKDIIRVIFQINNMDPSEHPFTDDHIVAFLNSIRDILTDKVDASFIINGATGLASLINKRVRRLAPCIISEKISALSENELVEALRKRIKNSGHRGEIPFTSELIGKIYHATNKNFRQTLGIMEELTIHYDDKEPLIQEITLQDCCHYFFSHCHQKIQALATSNKGKVIRLLSQTPALNIGEIATQTNIKPSNTSKLVGELEADGALIKVVESSSTRCLLAPPLYFAALLYFPSQV